MERDHYTLYKIIGKQTMVKIKLSEKAKNWLFFGLQVLIVFLALALGYLGSHFFSQKDNQFSLLRQAKNIMVENTILELPSEQALAYGMIRGMLATLDDPYSQFVEPAAHEVQTDELSGRFGGIGVRLERDTDMNLRLYPLPNSPALTAGIEDGDILVGVDDLIITQDTEEIEIIAAVRGPVGEEVKITVLRGTETLDFTIKREEVPLPTVSWNLLPEADDIGMVKVNLISETTSDEIIAAIEDLSNQGAGAFVLDLRNNGGGLVNAGVAIAELFLEEGEILHQEYKNKKEEVFTVEEPGIYTHLSMVVLVNENTASAAEIVAGAIKKHNRAPIIGAPTYGKTSIQYIFDLDDGSSIHITSGKWWIPGVSFPLKPDHLVLDDPTGVNALQKAIDMLQGTR